MDGTTTMQGTEQEVQNTATETQGQQTAESTPEKVSTLQKFIDGLFGGGKKAEGAEPEKKDGDPAAEKAEEEKSFTQADVDAAIEAAKQQWYSSGFLPCAPCWNSQAHLQDQPGIHPFPEI